MAECLTVGSVVVFRRGRMSSRSVVVFCRGGMSNCRQCRGLLSCRNCRQLRGLCRGRMSNRSVVVFCHGGMSNYRQYRGLCRGGMSNCLSWSFVVAECLTVCRGLVRCDGCLTEDGRQEIGNEMVL